MRGQKLLGEGDVHRAITDFAISIALTFDPKLPAAIALAQRLGRRRSHAVPAALAAEVA